MTKGELLEALNDQDDSVDILICAPGAEPAPLEDVQLHQRDHQAWLVAAES